MLVAGSGRCRYHGLPAAKVGTSLFLPNRLLGLISVPIVPLVFHHLLQFSQTAFIGYGMLRRAFVADFDAMEQPFQYVRTAWHQRYLLDDPFFFVALFDVFILYGFPKELLLKNLLCKDFK